MPLGRVVVVDDDAPVRKALLRLLRAAGYEAESCEDAAEYLSRDPPEGLACLVLDVRMPGMSGLDLQRIIGGTTRALPIVFITGHGDSEVRAQALSAGAVAVLDKPLDETMLLAAIERAFAR